MEPAPESLFPPLMEDGPIALGRPNEVALPDVEPSLLRSVLLQRGGEKEEG